MAKRTIGVAHWRCDRDGDGVKRLVYRGDVVDLSPAEIRRGEKAGVFKGDQPLPTATTAAQLEAQLANIEPRVTQPAGAAASDAAPLHHDILTDRDELVGEGVILRADGEDVPGDAEPVVPQLITEPVSPDPTATIEVTPPAVAKRPANAATVDTWRDYIRTARPDIPREQLDEMTKDELKAAAPKEG